jgi:hypothetical protein
MRKHPNISNPNDDRTRLYVALLLVILFALLSLATPFVPSTREALAILGPFVGYAVRYLFEARRGNVNEE